MKKIVVLIHKRDTAFNSANPLVKLLMKEWAGMGFATALMRGADRVVPANLVVPHVDLTIIPKAYGALLRNYPLVISRNVRDISKSKISVNLLQRNDPYRGPVIDKTDCN